ncbi:methylated-DNA--[protein]-cysteine S-methyltransferase [Enterococcus faecalis]
MGSPFQQKVWATLVKIPIGKISTYYEIATALQRPNAVRAVGNANDSNQLAILIPYHRVINTNGNLGGYGGGIERKKYLLQLEQKTAAQRITTTQPFS